MGYRAQNLFEEPFTDQKRIIVAHNLDIEYPGVRVLIGGEVRPDLVVGAAVDQDDPTNRLVVLLDSNYTGVIQICNFDIQPVGVQSATLLSLLGEGAKLVFGDEYTYAEDRPAATTSSTTFVQRLRLTTPDVPIGSYRINTSFLWNLDSTSNDILVRIELNDTDTVWEMASEPKDSSSTQDLAGMGHANVQLSGINTFDLDFAVESGATTARIKEARLEFWRV